MQCLELLAPARNKEIGIAAIDCGADAVYIAGPDFGARKAAGNGFDDIAELCTYAHRFGVRIFVTYNTLWRDGEEEQAHAQMLLAQQAGADAFIIREPRIAAWPDITVPLHASTQCAIRDVERARLFESLGCERIILERQLSLDFLGLEEPLRLASPERWQQLTEPLGELLPGLEISITVRGEIAHSYDAKDA
jgi:putative protease